MGKRKKGRQLAAAPPAVPETVTAAAVTSLDIPSRADTVGTLAPATPSRAVTLPAVWACVDLITSTALMVPLRARRGRDTAPLPEWLRRPERWNDNTASLTDLTEHLVAGQALHGAGYLWADSLGPEVWQLYPVDPSRVAVEIVPKGRGREQRRFIVDGSPVPIAVKRARNNVSGLIVVPHRYLPGMAEPIGPVQAAREAVAGYLQTESYGVDIFAAGVPHGTLSTEQALPEETLRRYADAWRADARNSVRVLSGGLTFTPFKLAPRDAAWLEARAYDAAEVARIFNIPAHKLNLAVSGGMTYNNAETLDRDFLRGLAAGYLRPVETAFGRLLSPGRGENEETAVSYDYSAFMRATTAERYSAYQSAIAGGWLTVDEVRAMEGMPPLSET